MKKYSETGQFSPLQQKWAKEIATRLKKLRQSGCVVFGKQDTLYAYLSEDYNHSTETGGDYSHVTPCLDCGHIDDAGADDEMYFEEGYIIGE